MKIVFATANPHKAREVAQILTGHEILSLHDIGFEDEIAEPYPTLSGNALQKARVVFDFCGIPCFAEDTGLEVDALGGMPGVRTARYAGEPADNHKNMTLLLNNIKGHTDRSCQFRTVLAYVTKTQQELFTGIVRGRLAMQKRGAGGFGYDPIFVPEGHSKTFAELADKVKNTISHRSRAVVEFQQYLAKNDKNTL